MYPRDSSRPRAAPSRISLECNGAAKTGRVVFFLWYLVTYSQIPSHFVDNVLLSMHFEARAIEATSKRTSYSLNFIFCQEKNWVYMQMLAAMLAQISTVLPPRYLLLEASASLAYWLIQPCNTLKVRLPIVQDASHLPTEGRTCTLLSALYLNCDYDIMISLRIC